MALETTTDVESISSVLGPDNEVESPANAKQQQEIADAIGNHQGVRCGRYEPDGTDAEPLPAESVIDGVEALIQGHTENAQPIHVGGPEVQPVTLVPDQPVVLPVADLSDIHVRCPGDGDAAAWILVGGGE